MGSTVYCAQKGRPGPETSGLGNRQGPAGVGMKAVLKMKENRQYPEDMPYDFPRIKTLTELLDVVVY